MGIDRYDHSLASNSVRIVWLAHRENIPADACRAALDIIHEYFVKKPMPNLCLSNALA